MSDDTLSIYPCSILCTLSMCQFSTRGSGGRGERRVVVVVARHRKKLGQKLARQQRERVEKPVRPRKPAGQKFLLDDVEDHEHHVDRREQQGDGRHERQRRQHD